MKLDILQRAAQDRITEDSSPSELIDWVLKHFADRRMVVTTAFGMEGCALVDMIARRAPQCTVAYIDTGFLFPETLELRDRLAARHPHVDFVAHYPTLDPAQQAERHGDRLWAREPNACCHMRKVEPMGRILQCVDLWITALRRSQSKTRAGIRVLEWNWQYQVLKFAPLAAWERHDVWEYMQARDVPYNRLHERGYPSIGCTHCTVPVPGTDITTYSREGRWNGQEKTECGLHGDGI